MSKRTTIDARGSFCPGPMMELIAALKQHTVGDEVEVFSRDKGSANDIPAWTKKVGHQLVSIEQRGDYWSIIVRKMK
ncbi:MAG: sulfurtransferase TusA family protein [Methyloceanibacter sp.]|jgi:TusA-related sulfurtransferase